MNLKYLFAPLLLAAVVTAGCRDFKDPEFRRVENFGLKNVNLQEATIGFHVTYFNPNGFGVTVKEAEADVYLDSTYLGKFTQDQTVDVRKDADFSIPFSGKIPLATALGLNFEDLSRRDVLLRANGSAKVGKAGIYISKPIKYEGKHRLDQIRLF